MLSIHPIILNGWKINSIIWKMSFFSAWTPWIELWPALSVTYISILSRIDFSIFFSHSFSISLSLSLSLTQSLSHSFSISLSLKNICLSHPPLHLSLLSLFPLFLSSPSLSSLSNYICLFIFLPLSLSQTHTLNIFFQTEITIDSTKQKSDVLKRYL